MIVAPTKNIKQTLDEYGYPFKSKEHSLKLNLYKHGSRAVSIMRYFREAPNEYRSCPNSLLYQTSSEFKLNISEQCCHKLKKEPARKYEKETGRTIAITGMTKEEKGQRTNITCIITDSKTGNIKRFHPLSVITKDNLAFLDWYIKTRNIELCELYYAPYNFQRTGCKGCPFSLDLQEQLDIMAVLIPEEKKQCEMIWKPVYDEYRRIGYRLRKGDLQQSLFEK